MSLATMVLAYNDTLDQQEGPDDEVIIPGKLWAKIVVRAIEDQAEVRVPPRHGKVDAQRAAKAAFEHGKLAKLEQLQAEKTDARLEAVEAQVDWTRKAAK